MDHKGTAKRWLHAGAITAFGLTLAACDQIEGMELPAFLQSDSTEAGPSNLAAAEGTGETRDVEAPEVFEKTEAGLWDGRPSLGGIWVAHPDVGDPERVIIRNEENGRFVEGALFRRERENPGPSLQVSSDAAEELGMLAGAPARLNVVALRREEIAPAAPVVPDVAPVADGDVALAPPAAISETPLDAIGDVPALPDSAAVAPAVSAPSAAAVASIGAIAAAAAAAAPAVEAPAAPEVLAPVLPAAPEVSAPVVPTTPAPSAAATSTIGAIAGAAAAVAAAEAEAGITTDALPAADATVGAPLDARGAIEAPVPLPEPVTSGLEKPFIQVGIFSVEANANDAADTLRGDGVSSSVVEQNSSGTAFWRVLVGPAPTAQDRTAVLAKVQALGFNDAYFVSN